LETKASTSPLRAAALGLFFCF